ncbi:hypothetical protein ACJQWK_09232 [Exserohilum turcicum]|uniref:Uncharacterized protein n=1 Tax=Exserohilum turcicum (strain 28A) TaxID=671987 RepID=R0IX18_EXST2|nr:uncharacterized protein SETTUDRAFT_159718 [Exserohilum turcica Et28A]EOA89320.1 hypothetical protein SETTUDRAFT_159718 [Exserohilum turcica Et28A]
MAPFIPSRRDVLRTRALLHYRLGLPNELVLDILDKAHYWVERIREFTRHEVLLDDEFSLNYSAACPCLGIYFDSPPTRSREKTKLREMEFLIVSHDQGWTTEDTAGTFKTSSWFEVSILRSTRELKRIEKNLLAHQLDVGHFDGDVPVKSNIHKVLNDSFHEYNLKAVPRPSSETEPQRMHCREMQSTLLSDDGTPLGIEGEHAWYLQGNEVGRASSVFDGEFIRRYRVVWGCKDNPAWEGNEGAGRGEGFIDTLKDGDWICIWARAKRRGWENHVHGIRVTLRYTI